jgi:exosortase H (IPTLxxWG-CTERM-specific)
MTAHRGLRRPEVRFILVYLLVLTASFTVIAIRPVNDGFVVPYTGLVARASAGVLDVLGEEINTQGCRLSSPRFGVTINNGCNGLITSIVFLAGVLAFPSRPMAKLVGAVIGLVAIQGLNLIRIVALFFTGVYLPDFFDTSHIVVWQTVVVLSGIALWIVWASRVARAPHVDGSTGSGRG